MTVFIALLLTAAVFIFIAMPLIRQRKNAASSGDDRFRELSSKRDTTYSMLKELEFDLQSGLLTEQEYRDLETRYKRKAISILKDVDGLEKDNEVEDTIEAQVKKLHLTGNSQGKGNQVEDDIEKEVLRVRQSRGEFCAKCGTKTQKADRFCASCGARLG